MSESSGKKFFKIREVAQMFGVNASLLRFWESEFNNLKPLKTKGGSRLYNLENIEVIRNIYRLTKEQGFTLQGAKEIIDKVKVEGDPYQELSEKLYKIKSYLEGLRKNLDE